MIRRSRISVRPNVRPAGRAATASREAPQGNETPADLSNNAGGKAEGQEVITEVKGASTGPVAETNNNTESQSGDVTSQSDLSVTAADVAGQSASTSSVATRRKRFSVLPNLNKPRSIPASTLTYKLPKSPVKPEMPPISTHISSGVSESLDKNKSTKEPAAEPLLVSTKSHRTPATKLPSSSTQNISRSSRFSTKAVITTDTTPDKDLSTPGPAPKLPSAPLAPSVGKSKQRKPKPVTASQVNVETSAIRLDTAAESSCPTEGVCSDPVSESQKETVAQDGTQLNSPEESKKTQQHVPLALRSLNDPVDRLRLARARKLRELLKKEINKEKKKEKNQKPQTAVSEQKKTKDHTKMTMRELIYYLPATNPMKSYSEDEQKAEMNFPSSPKAAPNVQLEREENAAEEEQDGGGEEEEEPMLAPRVKVAEDGSLIIDEESLTVQVQRMKGPNPVEERDPIFERGSTTTYSSFRKGTYTKPWSSRETDMFFLAISMVGTDFSMIGQLFPHRGRLEIKNKFKKEERANSWRIDKAFKEKRRLDLNFFNELLEKILQVEQEKRKQKKRASRLARIPRHRPRERKRKIYSSDSSEDESTGSEAMEGEKENENACNDGESIAAPKRKRTRASQKESKQANQSAEQEAEEEAERNANEESSPVNELDSVDAETESIGVKPGRGWRNSGAVQQGQRKAQDTHTSAREESTKESALSDSENEEEPDLTSIQEHILNKPTRSGRIPKLSQHMIHAVADEEDDEEVEQVPSLPLPPYARPRGSRAKRGKWHEPRRGKSKLLTIRASPTEEEEDEEDDYGTNQEEVNYSTVAEEENQPFVPMGLRSVTTVQSEVEETMEELDISVNVPDVLGISQNAVCPESSCERALAPMGSVPCEHQLDLLVDVIEFLAPDHIEVSEEAARTLLTIGHSAHVTQTGEPSSPGDVIIVDQSSSQVDEKLMETMDQSETRLETCDMVTFDLTSCISSETDPVCTVSTGDKASAPPPLPDSISVSEPGSIQEGKALSSMTPNLTVPEPASQTRMGHLPKPKPDLGRASRTMQREPAEGVTSSAEIFSDPVKADVPSTTAESQISRVNEAPSEPEPEEQKSELCEGRENGKTESCTSVLSGVEKTEHGESEKRTCIEEEKKEEMLQTHSESESQECSMKTSQPVRRCRGPKPKPNLMRGVRTTHTITHIQQDHAAAAAENQAPAITFPDIHLPDEGANIIPEIDILNNAETTAAPEEPEEPPARPSTSSCKTEGNAEESDLPTNRKCPPERGRRAKLQLKPNTIQRKNAQDLPSSDETSSVPASSCERMLEEPEPGQRSLKNISSLALTESASLSDIMDCFLVQSPIISPPPSRTETPPPQASSSSQSVVENIDLPGPVTEEPSASAVEAKSQPVHQITPLSSTVPLTRPGRRPKGFLSFMSNTSSQRTSESTRVPQKPAVISSRRERRRAAPSTSAPASTPAPASTSASAPPSASTPVSAPPPASTLVSAPPSASTPASAPPPASAPASTPVSAPPPASTPDSAQPPASAPPPAPPQASAQPPASAPDASSHAQAETSRVKPSSAVDDKEPTSVAAYFFNDIFTVVDEQDEEQG